MVVGYRVLELTENMSTAAPEEPRKERTEIYAEDNPFLALAEYHVHGGILFRVYSICTESFNLITSLSFQEHC